MLVNSNLSVVRISPCCRRIESVGVHDINRVTRCSVNSNWSDLGIFNAALTILEWALLISVFLIIPTRRSPEAARSWLLLFFIAPLPALVLYCLIGRAEMPSWRKKRFAQQAEMRTQLRDNIVGSGYCTLPSLPPHLQGTARLIESVAQYPCVSGNDAKLIDDYDLVISSLVSDIDSARYQADLLFYIFADDQTGGAIMDALARAAQRGVRCRVLVDAIGSMRWYASIERRLSREGVTVRRALPFRFWHGRAVRLDLRNHRKMAVIDNIIGYFGSQNIIDASSNTGRPNREVVVRVQGPIAAEGQVAFASDWHLEAATFESERVLPLAVPAGNSVLQVLTSGPDYGTKGLSHLLLSLLYEAKYQITIVSPYFVPEEVVLTALATAVGRGVTVTVIVPYKSDQRLVDLAQRSFYETMVKSGVNLLIHNDGFLHAKCLTVDREVAVVGSANLDARSLLLNAETSIVIYDPSVVASVREAQQRFEKASEILDIDRWATRGYLSRVAENVARLASPLL
jgi:cardiolipin synthase